MDKIIKISIFFILMNFAFVMSKSVYAHETLIDTDVDSCESNTFYDGVNETWYILSRLYKEKDSQGNYTGVEYYRDFHISHELTTIKYYFANTSKNDDNYTWSTDVSVNEANIIKEAFANSIKKWNNIYFYEYTSNGAVVKNKLINIVEGTASDHDITIYPVEYYDDPINDDNDVIYYASTGPHGAVEKIIDTSTNKHYHYNKWNMYVNVHYFYTHDNISQSLVNKVRDRTGMHEMGHVLGIYDVDNFCSASDNADHHLELLMGYGSPTTSRASNATYKDIAGVAITRNFHTSSEHKWLIDWNYDEENGFKLICSICNGIKYIPDPSGYVYDAYLLCNNNHNLSSNNMIALASYLEYDYYKCKYCRYVAPYDRIIKQTYTYEENGSSLNHNVNSITQGLEYSFVENHSYTYGYKWKSNAQHIASCICGKTKLSGHAVVSGSNVCIHCKGTANAGVVQPTASDVVFVTSNGSCILVDGTVILKKEDVMDFYSRTLIFSNSKNEIMEI